MIKNIKKYLSVLLCFALVLSTFVVPSVTKTVYAEASKVVAPTTGTYLAKADFTSDSFNDTYGLATDSQITKKVYFGASGTDLEWWMAGVEAVTGSDISATTLVLFSSKALSGTVAYNTPSTLANYATSYIHNTVLNNLLNSRFSPSEQKAIVPVTLKYAGYTATSTSTYKNDMEVTDCKLYLPDGTGQNQMIKVGQSNIEVKNTADKVGKFWLSSAPNNHYDFALVAEPGEIKSYYVRSDYYASVVPTLNLNLSSVIFSSAAPAASSTDADLTSGTTMTLRFNSAQTVTGSDCADRIQSSVTAYADGVAITSPTNGEYLYVQWNDGKSDNVKSIALDSQNEIEASDISTAAGFELNDSCKIWLEKKVDNITYAKNVELSNTQEKVFKDANKPVEPTTKTAIFDGQGKALYTSPTEIVTNSTIIYSYTKDNETVTSTTIPMVSEIGTYTDIKYIISADGYKEFTSTPTTFTINGPEYKVELISDYTNGKALILVFTNADLDKQNVNVKYANKNMYKLENSGYAVSGTNVTYTNVYGIIAKNSSESNLTPDGVKNNITFVGGSTNTSINCGNCDVNGRGSVDITDAVAAINVYNNYELYFSGEDKWNKIILKADVDHNKKVDTGDVAMILKENAKAYK